MRTWRVLVLAACVFAGRALAQNPAAAGTAGAASPTEPAFVEGRVLNAITGEPIRRVNLGLRPVFTGAMGGAPPQAVGAVSDAEGRFKFENLEPGRYSLYAEKTGFVRQTYGSSAGQFGAGTHLTLSPGQRLKDLDFKLTPQAVISGPVVDEEGEPVSRAMIQVMRRTAYSNRPAGMMGDRTNDIGEFRIANLAPGKYILRADYRSGMFGPRPAPAALAGSEGVEDYVPTYYPASTDAEGAVPVTVGPGQEVSGIEIRLQKARVYRVRGRIIGMPADTGGRVQVSLQPQRRSGGAMVFGFGGGNVKPGGSFEIPSVQPGAYFAVAMRVGDGRPENIGRAPVNVGNGDVDGVIITMGSAITLTGSVRMEGDDRTRITGSVFLLPAEGFGFGMSPARIQEDGTFKLDGVSRDKYYVMVQGLPEGTYVKQVRAGSIDVLENGLDLSQSESAPPLQILISPKSATIEGVVHSEDQPWAGAVVTLLPEPLQPERLPWLQKSSTSDQNGRFSLKGVAPGEYRLYAWQESVPIAELDPDQFKTFESGSVKINLGEGAREQVELRVIKPQ